MRRALSPSRNDGSSKKPFIDPSTKPQSLGAGTQDSEKSRPLDLPGCSQTVRELFYDEEWTPEWGFHPFDGGDVDDLVTGEQWQGDVFRGHENPHRDVEAPPPEAFEPAQTQTLPVESESAHFNGAEAIRVGLKTGRPDAFKELRKPPDMPLADMLTVASTKDWVRAKAYLEKAAKLCSNGDLAGGQAFTLLFLAAGTMTLESAADYGLNPCLYVSHEVIQGLDTRSRQVLERRWQSMPNGRLRALVMGCEAAVPLAVETEPLPRQWSMTPSVWQVKLISNDVRQGSAAGSQTGRWPDVLETLKDLVDRGSILAEHVVQLIRDSASLPQLQARVANAAPAIAISVLAAAATLYKRGEKIGARYLALVFLMTGRVPYGQHLKGYRFNELISHDDATSLCEQFGLDIDLKCLL